MQPNYQDDKKKEFGFTRKHFDLLRQKAKAYSGIHVTDDKYEMYYARLAKRLRLLKLNSFNEYLSLIDKDPEEFIDFINAITTNVTSFDREAHHFEYLKERIKANEIHSLSIWSAGCSSGEEPYSIIVNLYELARQHKIPFKLVGTDLDTNVLARAANGVYDVKAIEKYSKETKKHYFLRGVGSNSGKCRVKKPYRELVQFKQLNLINNWRFDKPFDVIFCRNVMIYFENDMKHQILKKYAEHLVPGGLLFLGHSESISKTNSDFDNVGKTIYRKRRK
ncbi:protein-glutamate O-methyltransferase CheR [Paraneptunicella aestuarii]|uniref:CheR family methyltransferase n=1 Tax=Paraneptunicella aestuarii TaxID=2831148 RepID=UPI001E377622|nr:protein-glutamate O-methyltransferase CheR [Paraneptunicella aestuarii]UAA38750.1 protein-glutamate O-methyltransferase CheR [Paraneptunicella aestuarii]